MALIESSQIQLGSKMPSFRLNDANGISYSSQQLLGKNGLLLAFTCNHCPYAIAVWPRFIELSQYAIKHDINVTAINPNIHPDYPLDSPEEMKIKINEWKIPFPYLVDESQSVARDFDAQCTPDIYLYNGKCELVYHGRIDDNWQNEQKVTKQELKHAIQALASGQSISTNQKPSMGCSIKWKNQIF